jgi:hypothetical protein
MNALQYAFESFNVGTAKEPIGNATANTTAYSATLDCEAYSPADSEATYQTDLAVRCEISGFIDIFSATSTYAMSSTNQCNNSEHGRIGIFAGIYSDASSIKIDPASYSLVSRMVNDWNISGPVTIATHPHKSPKLLSFNTTTNGVRCIFFCMGYWRTTPRITSFLNPQITSRLMPLGFRYIYTRKHKMQHRHNALSMKTSLADMFQTLYAGMVIQVAFPQAGSPR